MTTLDDPDVRSLLDEPNYAVISTTNADGSVHSTVVWVDVIDGRVAVNTSIGRTWPTNLERDPRATVVVIDRNNPFAYVEVRGATTSTTDGADDHIDRLAKKYLDADSYPFRTPSETRITYLLEPQRVNLRKQ